MPFLNRVALTITRKQPYADWANGTDGPVPSVTYPPDNPRTIYLVPAESHDPDLAQLLEEFWEDIFEEELSAWMLDESTWPKARTRQIFDAWFDAEVVDAVIDLAPDEPLSEADVDEADIQYALEHCAWCDLELEPENRRMSGVTLPERELFASREGLTLSLPVRDRFLTGIVTTPDSPAALKGEDLVFCACTSRCEKIIQKEAARAVKRVTRSIRQTS